MHSMIAGPIVILSAMLLAACAGPVGPSPDLVGDPTVVATLARQRPKGPSTVPDSIGIPPTIPPIPVELPAEFDRR